MKKLIAGLCLVVMSLVFIAGCNTTEEPVAEPTYQLRLAGIYAEDYPITESLNAAADTIREKTNGDVDIKVYPSGQLGDWTQIVEEIMKGTIDMASCPVLASFDSRLEIQNLPYLTTSYEDSIATFSQDTYYYETLEGLLDEQGITLLNIYLDGFMGVGANEIADRDVLMDPTVDKKDLKYRCPGMQGYVLSTTGMGYTHVSIPYSEVYTSLQTGIIDGWIGGPAYLNSVQFADVITYFVNARYIQEIQPTYINQELLKSMPEEYQTIILEAFAEEAVNHNNMMETYEAEALQSMADAGIEIIYPTDEELATMAAHFQDNIWPELTEMIGDEIMTGLLDSVNAE